MRNLVFKAVQDRSPVFFGEVACPGVVPFQRGTLKGVFHLGKLFFLSSFFASSLRCRASLSVMVGYFAKAQEFGLLVETVGHAPEFSPSLGDGKIQPSAVKVLLFLVGGFQTADLNIGERHVGTPCSWLDGKIPT